MGKLLDSGEEGFDFLHGWADFKARSRSWSIAKSLDRHVGGAGERPSLPMRACFELFASCAVKGQEGGMPRRSVGDQIEPYFWAGSMLLRSRAGTDGVWTREVALRLRALDAEGGFDEAAAGMKACKQALSIRGGEAFLAAFWLDVACHRALIEARAIAACSACGAGRTDSSRL